ncbi:MAG TPA: hypothetical protein VKA43_13230 [Gammaproteobacteria bacterium]|nr:hypothetical protein [Gammaproteobacteria bacterium]
MAGFKTQGKRQRELAKLNKRKAKDEKRAARKAERSGSAVPAATPAAIVTAAAPKPAPPTYLGGVPIAVAPPVRKSLTLAEAVQRWKSTKVVKAKTR